MSSVDVVVPCYNYGRFLRECVESVLTQEGVSVRVLIIDDCSSDDSEMVGRALAAKDSRVEFRRHEKNQGHIATYNEGLDWIGGNYCLVLSADDLLTEGALLRAAEFLDVHPNAGFVYGKVIRWDVSGPRPRQTRDPKFQASITLGLEWIRRMCEGGEPLTTSPEVVVRTSLHKQTGKYRADLPHWADVELLMRFASRADIGCLSSEQAFYRIHHKNMHNGFNGLRELNQRRTTFRALFDEPDFSIPGADGLKKLALRTLAENACWRAHRAIAEGQRPACKSLLQFALETDPTIRSSSVYQRTRWKRLLGPIISKRLAGFRKLVMR